MKYFLNALWLVAIKSGQSASRLWLYVLLGIVIGEALRLTSWSVLMRRACKAAPITSVFLASILGIVSPLCTYGTAPVMVELAGADVALGPLVSFLSSSSLMNPQLFIMTWGGISPEMALSRVATALLFAVAIGLLLLKLPRGWVIQPAIGKTLTETLPVAPTRPFALITFLKKVWKTVKYISFYLGIGIVLGAFVEVFVPRQWMLQAFRPGNRWGIALAALISVPLYACGGGTIPLVRSLLTQGLGKGGALAFFIAGPATRIPPLMALAAVIRPRFLVVYVVLLLIVAFVAGVAYEA